MMNYKKYGKNIEGYCPNITIVIPAYNAEKFLARCINSAIFQKNIDVEVIVVIDEGTTDSSVDIVQRYADNFQGKVFYIIKEGKGLSPARQVGMENAKAPYVLFVDVDDYIDQQLGKVCYNLAIENNADIVSYNFAEYKTYKNRLIDYKAAEPLKTQTIQEAIERGGIGWWKFLFSVQFLKDNAHFYDMLWEDAGEIPALLSKAKNYIMTPKVLYYKINNEESMTETFPKISRRFVEHTLANTMTLENVEHKYYSSAVLKTAKRMIFPFFKFYSYYDHLVEYMKEHSWIYSFEKDVWEKLSPFEKNFVAKILEMPEPSIPLNIYINGFTKTDMEFYKEEAQKGFWNWEKLIVLDESNCDINENLYIQEAYKKGETDFVAGYFALKNIYEHGGIYIGRKLRLNSTLNSMRYQNCFFGFETENSITSEVFGAKSGDDIIKEILSTFLNNELYFYDDSIGERIRTILIGKCGIKLTGREQHGLYGVAVYPALVFAINANGQCKNISYIEEDSGEILTISKKIYEHCINYQMQNADFLKTEIDKYKAMLDNVKKELEVIKAENNRLKMIEKENNRLKTIEKENARLKVIEIENTRLLENNTNDVDYLNNLIRDREQEIKDLKKSFTYRFGYIVTYIPRRIYRFITKKPF